MGSVRGWLAGDWPSTGGVLNITAEAWTAGFHWWRSGNITRTQNVSKYMLVLALCPVQLFCILYWRPARWSVCLPLLIFPCIIKSRSSLLAPAHPGGPGKRTVKRLWWWFVFCSLVVVGEYGGICSVTGMKSGLFLAVGDCIC